MNGRENDEAIKSEFLYQLAKDSVSIIDAIKRVRLEFNIDLGTAVELVEHHPAWTEKAKSRIDIFSICDELKK